MIRKSTALVCLMAIILAGCSAAIGGPSRTPDLRTPEVTYASEPPAEPDVQAPVNGPGIPPAGAIWFGKSFDTDTLAIKGRITKIGATKPFSFVAHLRREMDATDLVMRLYLNGKLLASNRPDMTGTSELWGFAPGPLFSKGKWKYELADIGGNVLAAGTITAT